MRPIWRQSNDVLDVPCVGSSVEGKSDNKNDDTDHFEVRSGDEGHEHHPDGRHKESQGSVHLSRWDCSLPRRRQKTFCMFSLDSRPLAMSESEMAPAAKA